MIQKRIYNPPTSEELMKVREQAMKEAGINTLMEMQAKVFKNQYKPIIYTSSNSTHCFNQNAIKS